MPKTNTLPRIDLAAIVDELGETKAEIAELKTIESALADGLKAAGTGTFEGRLFRATVSVSARAVIDRGDFVKFLIEAGVPSDVIIAAEFAATKVADPVTVRVSARKS